MLVSFSELLRERGHLKAALGAFTCYDFETASGVLAAAAGRNAGVVLLISRGVFAAPDGPALVAGLREVAARADARACLQLDHVADLELIGDAFELGCGAVMADGSQLPFAENAELVVAARAIAAAAGGAVEGELGHVAGQEDVADTAVADGFTDPEGARKFIADTGVDCLAVSIGNVHGAYAHPPELDWQRLDAINAVTQVPLSLHGASGLTRADVRRAVNAGIRKINVNTELRQAYLAATTEVLEPVSAGANLRALHGAQVEAVRAVAQDKLDDYTGAAK